ncbi:MAG: hypothetical protein OIN84_04060, partial [Candidatus Methanoperedens sp.]|nr:hypothetical protein [Candidatus Methanoperedens sp.]
TTDWYAANVMGWSGGGFLPVTGNQGELGDFTFTPMDPSAVSYAALASYDTAVLNVASYGMACNTNTLTPAQQSDLINFVADGRKLIMNATQALLITPGCRIHSPRAIPAHWAPPELLPLSKIIYSQPKLVIQTVQPVTSTVLM